MEKTAIDFLIEKIAENPSEGYYTINGKNVSKEIEEAKAIFRQQIEYAAFEMLDNETCGDPSYHEAHRYTASQFYNNKYGEK